MLFAVLFPVIVSLVTIWRSDVVTVPRVWVLGVGNPLHVIRVVRNLRAVDALQVQPRIFGILGPYDVAQILAHIAGWAFGVVTTLALLVRSLAFVALTFLVVTETLVLIRSPATGQVLGF